MALCLRPPKPRGISRRRQAGFIRAGVLRALLGRKKFTPRDLFRNGEQGAWYDPSDFSTMWQDSAGTTPVTAVTQPVGKILDKSGRGNHLIQATTTSRPTLQQDGSGFYYLSFDGVDDYLVTAANLDMSASDKVSVFAGVTKSTSKSGSFVCETSLASPSNPGAFGLDLNGAAANGDWLGGFLNAATGGSVQKDGATATITAGTSAVVAMIADAAGGATPATQIALRKNGVDQGMGSTVGVDTNGNLSAAFPMYVGARGAGTLALQGRIYSLIVRGSAINASQISATERAVGAKMGIAL